MEDQKNYRQLLARALLGQGMAGQAADKTKLQAQWQQEYTNAQMQGMPFPQFEEWMKQR